MVIIYLDVTRSHWKKLVHDEQQAANSYSIIYKLEKLFKHTLGCLILVARLEQALPIH